MPQPCVTNFNIALFSGSPGVTNGKLLHTSTVYDSKRACNVLSRSVRFGSLYAGVWQLTITHVPIIVDLKSAKVGAEGSSVWLLLVLSDDVLAVEVALVETPLVSVAVDDAEEPVVAELEAVVVTRLDVPLLSVVELPEGLGFDPSLGASLAQLVTQTPVISTDARTNGAT